MEFHDIVAAVLRRGDQVLLCHRCSTRQWYPNVWDLPGGHVELGERPQDALRRELIEELGVDIGVVSDEPVLRLDSAATGLDLTVWQVSRWRGLVENRAVDEHDRIDWFVEANLRSLDLAHPSYLALFQRLLATDGPRSKA